jgi:uncharacterized membrane protein
LYSREGQPPRAAIRDHYSVVLPIISAIVVLLVLVAMMLFGWPTFFTRFHEVFFPGRQLDVRPTQLAHPPVS